jgi:hypothetical protein
MSAKWVRSQQWDDRHLTGVLWPVKAVVRVFSWISTSVVLLSLVACFGILASVPIGLLAKIPTVLFYALTFVLAIGLVAVFPVWLTTRAMRLRGAGRPARFVVGIVGFIVLALVGGASWYWGAWPALRYDELTGSGVRFFGEFIEKYAAVQFRRLPMMEMSELEFYAWWPLRVVLLLFVLNLVTATLRRIEFTFPRIGVLTVHTGIITIALGSVYYSTHKQEGDMILLASGGTDKAGRPLSARSEMGFYDNTRTALWVTQNPAMGWDQRPVRGVPRYNDYNLDVVPRAWPRPNWAGSFGAIDLPVPGAAPAGELPVHLIDEDIVFRIVGYASYAELVEQWIPAEKAGPGAIGQKPERLRTLDMVVTGRMPEGQEAPHKQWRLLPDRPAGRVEQDMFGVEYTIGMSEERWSALASSLPSGTRHALLVEHPGSGFRQVYPARLDQSVTVGTTGYTLTVRALMDRPPMSIVTKGYEGASSSLAIVRVEPPAAVGSQPGKAPGGFDRWIYSRFPEIAQDMLDERNERGMPTRRDADPGIRIAYIDASKLNAYFDERPDGTVRAMVRTPDGNPAIVPSVKPGDKVQIVPMVAIALGDRLDNVVRVETPEVVPEAERSRDSVGNHESSAVAVEVRDKSGAASVHWVPFTKYLQIGGKDGRLGRDIRLPDGRVVSVAFGRVRHEFWPPMAIALHEFEMIPYEHSDTPKDYRSDVVVSTRWPRADGSEDVRQEIERTSLNNPLLVVTPYVAPKDTPLPARLLGRMLSWIAPNQYKFAQAGWDQAGWRESQQEVAAGRLARPTARFTILGVGNNPGIYIIASGAVMMSIGIPWAFYLKPWLMQREKRKIQERLAREGGGKPAKPKLNGRAGRHEQDRVEEGAST